MHPTSKTTLAELQQIITKMPLQVCCVTVLPEFGVKWRELSRAIRNYRLPIQPSSVARVLCKHIAKSLRQEEFSQEELNDVMARLRLKSVASQDRKWYVVKLIDREVAVSAAHAVRGLAARVAHELRNTRAGRTMTPEVHTVTYGDFLYVSVQMVSDSKQGSVLYLATLPGEPVALVSAVASTMLRPCVIALGYNSFEDAHLFGRDIPSLLRIHNRNADENPLHLTGLPDYRPVPTADKQGIDYTYKDYDGEYVDSILGPDPPLLTDLQITSTKAFFDPSRLRKNITIGLQLKSDNVAKSLKSWVSNKALAPTSDFFHIFHKVKCNRFQYGEE